MDKDNKPTDKENEQQEGPGKSDTPPAPIPNIKLADSFEFILHYTNNQPNIQRHHSNSSSDEEMEVALPPVEANEEVMEGTEGDLEREGTSKSIYPSASPPIPQPTLTVTPYSTTQHNVKRTRLPPLTINSSPGEKMDQQEEEKGTSKRKIEESSGKSGCLPRPKLVPSHNQIFIRCAPLPHSPTTSHTRGNAYSSSGDEGLLHSSEDESAVDGGTGKIKTPRIRRSSKRQKSECGKHFINVPLTSLTCVCKPRYPVDCMGAWASVGMYHTILADNIPAFFGHFRGKIINYSNALKHFAVKSNKLAPKFTSITMTTARAQLTECALYPFSCPSETKVDDDCEQLFIEAEKELQNEQQPAPPAPTATATSPRKHGERSLEAKRRRNRASNARKRKNKKAARQANDTVDPLGETAVETAKPQAPNNKKKGKKTDEAKKATSVPPTRKPAAKQHRKTYSGRCVVARRKVDGAMTEIDRRSILSAMATGLISAPGPAQETLDLEGVILNRGAVVINTPRESDQSRVMDVLDSLGSEFNITREDRTSRRYIIGLPGYMVELGAQGALNLLYIQNSALQRGSLTPISLFRGTASRPHPILFVDVSEEAEQVLRSLGFSLKTLTGPVGVRPAGDRR